MLSGGDEFNRTQQGNNNAYVHDSPLAWTPWPSAGGDGSAEAAAMCAFVQRLIALRASQPALRRRTFLRGRQPGSADVLWIRPDGEEMDAADWHDPAARALGMLLNGQGILERDARGEIVSGDTLLILLHAGESDLPFTLPRSPAGRHRAWELLVDTADLRRAVRKMDAGGLWMLVSRSGVVLRATSG
jgi:glycogen operon protein